MEYKQSKTNFVHHTLVSIIASFEYNLGSKENATFAFLTIS